MMIELLILRFVHIVGGVFWVGSGLFSLFFLAPALAQMGVGAAPLVKNLERRKLFVVLPTIALLTMLSGIRLMSLTGGMSRYMATTGGKAYVVGAIAAVVAFFVSVIVSRPSAVRASHLSQAAASDELSRSRLAAEIRALQRRVTWSSVLAVALLFVAAALMAVARYL
jgi:uncharacterized membrane protein